MKHWKPTPVVVGAIFGRLIVLRALVKNEHGHRRWVCKCDCGNIVDVWGYSLVKGDTRSCGTGDCWKWAREDRARKRKEKGVV